MSLMQGTLSHETSMRSISRALDIVGDTWTMLILRDAGAGISRFDDFRKSLSIAPNILARRLAALTAAGLLKRCQYSDRPKRFEYKLTLASENFLPILYAMGTWYSRHIRPMEGARAEV